MQTQHEYVINNGGEVCPKCGGEVMINDSDFTDGKVVVLMHECMECKGTWEGVFKLHGFENFKV